MQSSEDNHGKIVESYWNGGRNKIIRMYFYQQRGLSLFNELRYLILAIFGIYVLLKLSNPLWLLIMFVISVPILIFVGWLQVHHMAPVINWLDVTYGSYWTKKSMEWQERQVKSLESIDEKMGSRQ